MNFEEWYKFGTPEEQNCFMGDAEKGWDACKEEVLNIFKKYQINDNHLISIRIREEIEKL